MKTCTISLDPVYDRDGNETDEVRVSMTNNTVWDVEPQVKAILKAEKFQVRHYDLEQAANSLATEKDAAEEGQPQSKSRAAGVEYWEG